jgi:glycosyltransferase involved in cell wall biosynthesis
MNTSLIATVYNEGPNLHRLLDSILAQSRLPDEVIICDGGSQDETVATLRSYEGRLPGLRVVVEPGANISRGRNVAIEAANGPIIAVTDAGVRLDPDWLARLIAPFEQAAQTGEALNGVAGFFLPDVDGLFTAAMAATVLPLTDDIDPQGFLPSSRSVAFTKESWARAGGYPEWLDYCEDLIFDLRMNDLRPDQPTAFAWAGDALAYFRPRGDLSSFWRQYYRYARGDGKADLWRKRHALRYVIYLGLIPALVGHGVWGVFARWLGWAGLLAGGIAYCARPWQRLRSLSRDLSPGERLAAFALVPVIRGVGDLAKMAGYPVGLLWRWRNRQRGEIHWNGGIANGE